PQHPAAPPGREHPCAGVPDVGGRACLPGVDLQLRLGEGGQQPVPQVVPAAGVLGFQPVRVGVGGKVGGGQGGQGLAAHRLGKEELPGAAAAGQGAAVPEVEVIGAVHMDVPDVFGDVFDLGLVKQGRKSLGRHGGQDVQGAPEGQAGVAVILGPLVAAAVGAVVLKEAVQAVGGLPDGGPPLFLAHVGQQEKAEQDVLGAPAGPVAHGLVPVAHPPEVVVEVGGQDAGPDLPLHPAGQAGVCGLQLGPQQEMDGGQQGPGPGGKQVDQGAGGVGQGQLGGVPDVGVVGGQLPGAFFTDGPDSAGDAVQEAAPVLDALGGGQGAEPGPAGKAGGLPFGPLAGADKVQPEGQGQRGQ